MQEEKWHRAPERAIEGYERIPQQMGGKWKSQYVEPESLPEGRYDMIRLANNWMIRLSQLDYDDYDYKLLAKLWKTQVQVAEAGVNWLAILGHSPESVSKMSWEQVQQTAI